MIKIVTLSVLNGQDVALSFSDGTHGVWSAAAIVGRDTVLTRPLADAAYFGRAFIEGGALAWPNGLEFSPAALHGELERDGLLRKTAA